MTTDNLNPTDKLYEAGRQFDLCLSKYYLAGFSDELTDAFKEFKQALTAYEKSKEEQQSTQEPESNDGKMDFDLEIEGTAEILMGSDSLPANVIILSGLVNRATKDLTDEVERLKARIEELKKQNNELKNIDDCPHENVDMKFLRCTICLECGNIIDVID